MKRVVFALLLVVLSTPSVSFGEEATNNLEEQKFIRLKYNDLGRPTTLETPIIHYQGPTGTFSVDLIGAVHIADRKYYKELGEKFRSYDSVLYELIAPVGVRPTYTAHGPSERGKSGVSKLQTALKNMAGLSFQLEEIDYRAKNFVHADFSPDEFLQSMIDRKENPLETFMRVFAISYFSEFQRAQNMPVEKR